MQQRQQLRQLPRMIPEQIIAGEVLQMPVMDLEQHLQEAFEQNPALVLEEVGLCPMCDARVSRFPCPSCGHTPKTPREEISVVTVEDWETWRERSSENEGMEPFAGIANPWRLHDYLHGQWSITTDDESERKLGDYLIDSLDENGYLTEPLIEIADCFRLSVPQVEQVLQKLQELEPAGVGARDLRECLLLQCARIEGEDEMRSLVTAVLTDAWEEFAAHRWSRIARKLDADEEEVEDAADWIRANLIPYPGRACRESWEHLAPREEPAVVPDVIIRQGEDGLIVEIVESLRFRVGIDAEYQRLYSSLGRKSGANPEFDHIRKAVSDARYLVDALAHRRRTLYRVMTAIVEEQTEFLLRGPAFLRPLMQKTIALKVELHESTVCRALADKMVRIPSGEIISTADFFDASMPVKEALRDLISSEDPAHPLSDSRLADLLTLQGYQIARRTVAKYREALRIPTIELRQRA